MWALHVFTKQKQWKPLVAIGKFVDFDILTESFDCEIKKNKLKTIPTTARNRQTIQQTMLDECALANSPAITFRCAANEQVPYDTCYALWYEVWTVNGEPHNETKHKMSDGTVKSDYWLSWARRPDWRTRSLSVQCAFEKCLFGYSCAVCAVCGVQFVHGIRNFVK